MLTESVIEVAEIVMVVLGVAATERGEELNLLMAVDLMEAEKIAAVEIAISVAATETETGKVVENETVAAEKTEEETSAVTAEETLKVRFPGNPRRRQRMAKLMMMATELKPFLYEIEKLTFH